jgi:hypothetical protein
LKNVSTGTYVSLTFAAAAVVTGSAAKVRTGTYVSVAVTRYWRLGAKVRTGT